MPDAGDFEKDQPFSVGAWVKLPANDGRPARSVARMDDRQRLPRLGPVDREAASVGIHIVNKWPDDALKVVANDAAQAGTSGPTSSSTYDGSGKAAGREGLRQRRAAGDATSQADKLTGHHPHRGAAQARPAHTTRSTLDDAPIQDLRIYGRALAAGGGRAARPRPAARADLVGQAGRQADRRREATSCSTGGWRRSTSRTQELRGQDRDRSRQEQATIKARGTIAHVMQEKPEEAMAYILSAASTTSAATR